MCEDQAVTYLRRFGYAVIRLPKADITPLQVLAKSGRDLSRWGHLNDVLVAPATVSLPKLTVDEKAADISGQKTSELSVGVGLKILGGVISALGGSTIGLEVAFKSAKSLSFTFTEVLCDSVPPAQVDAYLGQCDLNPHAVHSQRLLEDDQIYVVSSCIKSRKFVIEAKSSGSGTFKLDVPVIQNTIGGAVNVAGERSSNAKITFEGGFPLVFGFQALRLMYRNGSYTAMALSSETPSMKALAKRGVANRRNSTKPEYLAPGDGFYFFR